MENLYRYHLFYLGDHYLLYVLLLLCWIASSGHFLGILKKIPSWLDSCLCIHPSLHVLYCRTHCSFHVPTSCLFIQGSRQLWFVGFLKSWSFGSSQHYWVHLGIPIPQRCMYFLVYLVNFCVAGSATDWYWNTYQTKCSTSLARLITRHWGSVVAGSFINGFFEVPTLLIELFTCHTGTCCNKLGVCCEQKCCCGVFFNLVRTDAYSYINLSG